LRVVGGSDGNSGISMGCSATERPTLGFRVSDNSQRAKIELNDANGAGGDRLGLFAFASGILTEVMSLRGSGNVGIGTTSPDHPLNTSRPLATVWRPDIRVGGYLGTQKGFIGSNNSDSRIKLSGGAEQTDSDGVSNWATAYGTTGAFVDIGELGATRFFNNSGLTANATYAPTERMRIDSSGNLLVGTTTTAGSMSNAGGITAPSIKTYGSSAAIAAATPTTIATISQAGLYIVHAYIPYYNAGTSDWSNFAIISCTAPSPTGVQVSVLMQASGSAPITFSTSGANIRATVGSALTLYWDILKLA
jgi:hypothetical protein